MIIDSGLVTGSLQVIGNTTMTGSLSVTGDIDGTLTGNARTATSASYALTSSYAHFAATPTVQGVQGTQGIQGIAGDLGGEGIQGIQGLQGATGATGTQGTTGTTGAQGTTGSTGSQGTTGTTGAQGTTGTTGTQGTTGSTGSQGTTGGTGAQGTTGAQGATGASAGITSYTNATDNRVLTSVSSTTINAEANLTFDGNTLAIVSTAPALTFTATGLNRSATIGITDGANMYVNAASGGNLYLGSGTTTFINSQIALHAGNYNSYAPSLQGTSASGTWGISITGTAGGVAWSNVSGRPGWLSGGSYIETQSNANSQVNSGFYENAGGGSNWPSATWYNSINVRHSNQGNYHGFQVAMSYYDNNLWFRSYQGSGTFQSWTYALSTQNYNSFAPTLTGGGASGTWGISITGNSNYATSAGSAGSATNATNSDNAGHLRTAYVGGAQSNPQTYFNNTIGLKAAMTGHWSVWSDTLWINGYSGGDVLQMCALHTLRNGTPRIAISVQASTATSYGTIYELVTSYNSPYALNMNQYVRTTDAPTFSELYTNGWFRNNDSNEGLYNQTTTQHWSSNTNGYWDASSTTSVSAIRFWTGGHVSSLRGYVYANNSNEIGFLNSAGNWSLRMDNSGNAVASGDVTAYSDSRVKENVNTLQNALEKVTALRGVSYTRIDSDDKKTKIGVIAQEILEVVPEVVGQDSDGMYNVAYGNLAGLFIEAIKEQQTQIDELKQLVKQLTQK